MDRTYTGETEEREGEHFSSGYVQALLSIRYTNQHRFSSTICHLRPVDIVECFTDVLRLKHTVLLIFHVS